MKEFKQPQKMLGPSQVAIVLGLSHFQDAESLRDQIEHGYVRDISHNRSTACISGQRDEARCRALYCSETGNRVQRCPFVTDLSIDNRFGGCGDGLVGADGGLEIKCQYGPSDRPPTIYIEHKVQAVAYMYLYKRLWWDIMVCKITIGNQEDDVDAVIERIYWYDYESKWKTLWYPKITEFCRSVVWSR